MLDTGGVAGRWEAFLIQVVEHPWLGVARAMIIAGSDKRGTIYGLYDLSAEIGVSPRPGRAAMQEPLRWRRRPGGAAARQR